MRKWHNNKLHSLVLWDWGGGAVPGVYDLRLLIDDLWLMNLWIDVLELVIGNWPLVILIDEPMELWAMKDDFRLMNVEHLERWSMIVDFLLPNSNPFGSRRWADGVVIGHWWLVIGWVGWFVVSGFAVVFFAWRVCVFFSTTVLRISPITNN